MSSASSTTTTAALNVLVTGGTAGIGLETIKQLIASPGPSYHILIGCRTMPSQESIEDLRGFQSSPRTSIEYLALDLASPQSVLAFPENAKASIQAQSREAKIDIVFLCAGMSAGSKRRSVSMRVADDEEVEVEETLYVNTLSHVDILNHLLNMDILTDTARISIVNSGRHLRAPKRYPGISPATVEENFSPENWSAVKAYDISKLIEMHFAFIVRDRIQTSQYPNRTVVSVRPHFVPETNLFRNVSLPGRLFVRHCIYWLPFATTLTRAGQTGVESLKDISIPSGSYVSKNGIELPAEECLDNQEGESNSRRREWEEWFIQLGIWSRD